MAPLGALSCSPAASARGRGQGTGTRAGDGGGRDVSPPAHPAEQLGATGSQVGSDGSQEGQQASTFTKSTFGAAHITCMTVSEAGPFLSVSKARRLSFMGCRGSQNSQVGVGAESLRRGLRW